MNILGNHVRTSSASDSSLIGDLVGAGELDGGMSVPSYISNIPIATTTTPGGIIVGDDLTITPEGRLSVDKTSEVESDNTKPVTSAAVYTQIGNINALLATI